jgi:hypothetical protein
MMAKGTATAAIPMITAKVIKTFSTGTSLSSLADRTGGECLLSASDGLPFDPMFLLSQLIPNSWLSETISKGCNYLTEW